MERFGDVGAIDDNMESFLSNDGDAGNLYGTIKQSPAEYPKESSKGRLWLYLLTLFCMCEVNLGSTIDHTPLQVSPLLSLVAYEQETAKLLAVIFLQMESCLLVLDMTRR